MPHNRAPFRKEFPLILQMMIIFLPKRKKEWKATHE